MNISLEQAIEIHARALARRLGHRGYDIAAERAQSLRNVGDEEGHNVWSAVSQHIQGLLALDDSKSQSPSQN